MRLRAWIAAAALAAVGIAACGNGSGSGAAATADTGSRSSSPASTGKGSGAPDWPVFGRTSSRPSSTGASIGISAPDAPRLQRTTIDLPGTVDSAPIYLGHARVGSERHDVFVMTTTYGRTLAVDAHTGAILWTYTPGGYGDWAGSYRITNATPASDRRHVFAAAPDGRIHKLSLVTGHEYHGRWPVRVTRLPEREKLTSSLNLIGGLLVVTTGGYVGDAPPYQGHVVTIARGSGRIHGVFNALCSDRHGIITPGTCPESGAAIWGRAGAVRAPDGTLLLTTGDARFDGRRHWGDSVLRLSRDARRLLGSYTPADYRRLEVEDIDMGSTGPVIIGSGRFAQSGKDGRIRVVSRAHLRARGRTGGELQLLPTPAGSGMFSAPAVWRHGGRTFVFATTFDGTAAYEQRKGRLHRLWAKQTGGTSPIVAGGLLYVYDPDGELVVYRPVTGRRIAGLDAGSGHWNSPAPGAGVIALPVGNANDHDTGGKLELYSLP